MTYMPARGGTRGGKDQFEWDDVKTDKHRENYLGHSVMAPVGRWQKGKDLSWYSKKSKVVGQKEILKAEIAAVKKAEEEAIAAALGLKPKSMTTGSVSKQELAEVCRRQSVEEKEGEGQEERMTGLGFMRWSHRHSNQASATGAAMFESRPVREVESGPVAQPPPHSATTTSISDQPQLEKPADKGSVPRHSSHKDKKKKKRKKEKSRKKHKKERGRGRKYCGSSSDSEEERSRRERKGDDGSSGGDSQEDNDQKRRRKRQIPSSVGSAEEEEGRKRERRRRRERSRSEDSEEGRKRRDKRGSRKSETSNSEEERRKRRRNEKRQREISELGVSDLEEEEQRMRKKGRRERREHESGSEDKEREKRKRQRHARDETRTSRRRHDSLSD